MMKKILMLVIVLLLVACENPVEPKQDENVFIIELYSYTAGAVTKPKPDAYYRLWTTMTSDIDINGRTDETGRKTLVFRDKNLNNLEYCIGFGKKYYANFEFGETHVYKGYF